jgi:Cyclic nucleotide-binding domain
MAFLGLADAIISIFPNPGGPGRTKIAPTGVALLPEMRSRPIDGYPSCRRMERFHGELGSREWQCSRFLLLAHLISPFSNGRLRRDLGLISGSLNISFPRSDGEDYTAHRAGSGAWIGDLALLSTGVRLVSVRAAEPSMMVQLPVRELTRLMRDDPRLYADFYALTYENFQTALRIVGNLGIPSTEKPTG